MAYIFEDEFVIYKHNGELKVSRNSATDMTKIIISDPSGFSFTFVMKPNRELSEYTIKIDDVNETRKLEKGKWVLSDTQ